MKGITKQRSSVKPTKSIPKSGIFPARVDYIIMDDSDNPKLFKKFGEWASIGGILFSSTKNPKPKGYSNNNFALPLLPNTKNYPLRNEVVYILSLPAPNLQSSTNSSRYYYLPPANIWNSVHHNALPDNAYNSDLPPSQQKDYQQTENGSVRRVTDGSTEIDLGNTFPEKLDVKGLQVYEGDVIHEGRFGNSLRFGSTVKGASTPNQWSDEGDDGDPITILRNGQYEDGKDPWIPTTENVDEDASSIYLTSTQKIPITPASENYDSYSSAPDSLATYAGSQILMNSGRIVLNTKDSDVMVSSGKTINLNAQETINFDTPKEVFMNTSGVYLGSKDADEPIVLGNKLADWLDTLLSDLDGLAKAMNGVGAPPPFSPAVGAIQAGVKLSITIGRLKGQIEDFKSKQNYTL